LRNNDFSNNMAPLVCCCALIDWVGGLDGKIIGSRSMHSDREPNIFLSDLTDLGLNITTYYHLCVWQIRSDTYFLQHENLLRGEMVIRATNNLHLHLLRDKLHKNVAHITWPLIEWRILKRKLKCLPLLSEQMTHGCFRVSSRQPVMPYTHVNSPIRFQWDCTSGSVR